MNSDLIDSNEIFVDGLSIGNHQVWRSNRTTLGLFRRAARHQLQSNLCPWTNDRIFIVFFFFVIEERLDERSWLQSICQVLAKSKRHGHPSAHCEFFSPVGRQPAEPRSALGVGYACQEQTGAFGIGGGGPGPGPFSPRVSLSHDAALPGTKCSLCALGGSGRERAHTPLKWRRSHGIFISIPSASRCSQRSLLSPCPGSHPPQTPPPCPLLATVGLGQLTPWLLAASLSHGCRGRIPVNLDSDLSPSNQT